MKKLIQRIRQFNCRHVARVGSNVTALTESFGPLPVGDWGEPVPHPHPHYAHRAQVQIRPLVSVLHCRKCGLWYVAHGADFRQVVEKSDVILPFPPRAS